MAKARYDGFADWYDSTFGQYGDENGSGGLLAGLLGSADPADRLCIDVECGSAVEEYDTNLQPWRAEALGGRIVPWNLAVTGHSLETTSDGSARHE